MRIQRSFDAPRTSRRAFLLGAVASVTRGNARAIRRQGPDLFYIPGPPPGSGYSTYSRHRAVRSAAGMDFDITHERRVHAVAAGIVLVVGNDPVSGRVIIVDHGFYSSRYAHLELQLVRAGQRVTRKDQIGVAGQTGYGAVLGPHLHLDLRADRIVQLVSIARGKFEYEGEVFLDPLDLAAYEANDSHGNRTLPFWQGLDADGVLDAGYRAHYEAVRASAADALARFPANHVDLLRRDTLDASGDRPRTSSDFGRVLRFLYEEAQAGRLPKGVEGPEIMRLVETFLSVRVRITAPLRDGRRETDQYYR